MKTEDKKYFSKPVFVAQLLSILLIWIMVIGISFWIGNLINLSIRWNDAIGASIGISIVAIPVFYALAGLLTFVFIGLHKEEKKYFNSSGDKK